MTSHVYQDPFVLEQKDYIRNDNLNFMREYISQQSHYLSTQYGISLEEAEKFIRDNLKPDGLFPFKDPKIEQTIKDENEDRIKVESTLYGYINRAIKNHDIISPTFTCYYPEKRLKSYAVDYTRENIAARSKNKKEMFRYEMLGDFNNYIIKKNEQASNKISNNSVSGASVIATTPMYNPNMHPSLTSTCRITSGYANANNEKLLGGNRHYSNYEIVARDIINIINHADYDAISKVVEKYNIHIPTCKEIMDIIIFIMQDYGRDRKKEILVKNLVYKLEPMQRVAFVYISDFYHLMKFNQDLVRGLLSRMSKRLEVDESLTDYEDIINNNPEAIYHLASQICISETKGIDVNTKDTKSSKLGQLLATHMVNIIDTVHDYADLFIAFFRTSNMPFSVSNFEYSLRKVVVMSDTDSTIFSVEDWIQWYQGKIDFSDEANAVFACMVFITTSTLKHILANMSANLGVDNDRIFLISMKNEFKFEVFVPTTNTKHYFALITYQEGNIYNNPKTEIKGVHLKSSNSPIAIVEEAQQMMKDICLDVQACRPIEVTKYIKRVADVERQVMDDVMHGGIEYYRSQIIKDASSYSLDEEKSLYKHYLLYNDTYGKIHGETSAPPYDSLKITTTLVNKTKFNSYIESLDEPLRTFFIRAKEKYGLEKLSTFYLPKDIYSNKGIPPEIVGIIKLRKMVRDICAIFYHVLETIGVFMLNHRITKLASDFY